jgi:hypothetical protein
VVLSGHASRLSIEFLPDDGRFGQHRPENDLRVVGCHELLVSGQQHLDELLASTETPELGLDVAAVPQDRQRNHPARRIDDLHHLTPSPTQDLTLREC